MTEQPENLFAKHYVSQQVIYNTEICKIFYYKNIALLHCAYLEMKYEVLISSINLVIMHSFSPH